jgi:hypothetical protein
MCVHCKHDVVKLLHFICFTVEVDDQDDEEREDEEEEKEDGDEVEGDDEEENEEENEIPLGIRKLLKALLY